MYAILISISSLIVAAGFQSASVNHVIHRATAFNRPYLGRLDASTLDEQTVTTSNDLPTSEQFNWEKQWYPIAVEKFTDKNKTHPMMLLGNDIVLWYSNGQWRVFEDSCPHRGVPLSEGRVEKNGELLCAYHAWTFDGEGECTSIPQTPSVEKEQAILPNACVHSYPTQVRQGLIWAWAMKGAPGSDVAIEAALKQPRIIEELDDPKYKGRIAGEVVWNFRDLPYGWDMFMENVLDPAHVAVSHHGIVGNRYNDPSPLKVTRTVSASEIPIAQGGEYNDVFPQDKGFKYNILSLLLLIISLL
jgi:phenylpropionate dioxygenase-like ring-hydroxylating dioxygenase large terminal subunit